MDDEMNSQKQVEKPKLTIKRLFIEIFYSLPYIPIAAIIYQSILRYNNDLYSAWHIVLSGIFHLIPLLSSPIYMIFYVLMLIFSGVGHYYIFSMSISKYKRLIFLGYMCVIVPLIMHTPISAHCHTAMSEEYPAGCFIEPFGYKVRINRMLWDWKNWF